MHCLQTTIFFGMMLLLKARRIQSIIVLMKVWMAYLPIRSCQMSNTCYVLLIVSIFQPNLTKLNVLKNPTSLSIPSLIFFQRLLSATMTIQPLVWNLLVISSTIVPLIKYVLHMKSTANLLSSLKATRRKIQGAFMKKIPAIVPLFTKAKLLMSFIIYTMHGRMNFLLLLHLRRNFPPKKFV